MSAPTEKPVVEKKVLAWPDLGFGVRYWPTEVAPRHVIDFEILEITSTEPSLCWRGADDLFVDDAQLAEVYASGNLKWDGCSNLYTDGLHFCGKRYVEEFGQALARLYDELGPLIPSWDP